MKKLLISILALAAMSMAQAKDTTPNMTGVAFLKVGKQGAVWCGSTLTATAANLFASNGLNKGAKEFLAALSGQECNEVPAGSLLGVHSLDTEHGVVKVMAADSTAGLPHSTFIYLPLKLLGNDGTVWNWVANPDVIKELNK